MTLTEAFELLRGALEPFGIELDTDVLDIWRDRDRHSRDPLPPEALNRLADVVSLILAGQE